jgi:hypothetical protein
MVKNSSFLRRKAVQFFARILRIFSQFCEFGRPKSEAKRKRTLLDFLRSEAKRIRFAFAFFRNKANSQCEFTALVHLRHLMRRLKEETFFQRLRKSSNSAESDLMKTITPTEMKAIHSVEWPGRQQIIEHEVNGRTIRVLLDVAHTPGLADFFLDFN